MTDRIGPYRVEEQIGVGGMGEVYKAYDDRLDRWVAIKRIRSDKDGGGESRERFQREARATARLNHSSIVHLYDIFRDGDNDCIVMEFVEGLTLDKLIRNGPLEAVLAATLGHEIASGLAEAHAKGIIHRDLKVENVIVTPDGHAKILDFGLARPLLDAELDSSLTGKGQLVGTSRAMSPEYVGGEDIDHRSDLFSLGVLLYESATSHSPFKAHNTLATLKQVMLHRQTPAHMVNSDVPEELSSIIENLLQKDPEDRPQDATEVARELGQISGKLSSGDIDRPMLNMTFSTTPTEVLTPSASSFDVRPRGLWWAMVATLLVAGVAATYSLTRWWFADSPEVPIQGLTEAPGLEERDRIVLADFQNLTGEPLLDDSIELAFRLGLEQSRRAYVLPRSQMLSALSRMERDAETSVDREVGMEIGQRENARVLVIGAIGKIGDTYSVTAEVADPKTGVNVFSTREIAPDQTAIVTALETVTEAIRVHLGESLDAIEETRRPLEKATTGNLEALKAYSLGVEKIAERDGEAAIQLLKNAIEIDPEFAMAHAKLATVYIQLDREDDVILGALDQALSLSDRLTRFESLYVEGWAARLHGDPGGVVRTWSLMSTLFPEEFAGHFNLGVTHQTYFERWAEAAASFERAVRVAAPENLPAAATWLGVCQIALERYEEARANFENAPPAQRQLALADLHLATRSYPEVRTSLERMTANASRQAQVQGRLLGTRYHADLGDFETALDEARSAGDLASKEGLALQSLMGRLAVAALQKHLAPEIEFQEALIEVVDSAKELMTVDKGKVDLSPIKQLALAGKLTARSGEIERAAAIDALISPIIQETPIATWRGYGLMLQGEILVARGESRAALERLEDALSVVDSFQVHESLAHGYESRDLVDAAIRENDWLRRHRGQGLVECLDHCQTLNVIEWSLASLSLGRLYEKRGEPQRALNHYADFLEQWPDSPKLESWRDAKRRLEALSDRR